MNRRNFVKWAAAFPLMTQIERQEIGSVEKSKLTITILLEINLPDENY